MKKSLSVLIGLIFSFVLIVACSPQAPPTQPSPPPIAPIKATVSTSNVPPPTSQDAAWEKVVEMAKQEGRVTAYSFNLTGDIASAAAAAFQNRYGIKLEIVGGVGATLAERIKTENNAKKFVADTFDTGVTAILPLKELGLLASIGDLPVQKEKDSWVLNPIFDPPDSTMVRLRIEYQTAVINTKLVRPEEEPQSFQDFLNAKWKGKKLVTAPPRVSWPLVYLHVMLPDTLNEDYFRALGKQDMLMVATMRDEATAVARGEAYAAVSTSVPIANSLIVSGAPLKPLTMREGTISSFPVVSVPKNAPHPNAARVFVNWWISPEGQTTINKAMGVPSIRKDVPDFSYQGAGLKPVKFLALDEVALRTVAKYVTEGRVDKFLGMDVK